ncbi:MAG: hypothetical protein ACRCV7_03850 [Culicoidibacterales bacterium]
MKSSTANILEITVNQQAYGSGSEKIAVNNQGYVYSNQNLTFEKELNANYILEKNKNNLQTHNTASGLDITSYSVYSGYKELTKKPIGVIVGVAGTDLKNSKDMEQNLNPLLNRSVYNHKQTSELEHDVTSTREVRMREGDRISITSTDPNVLYELEIRQKVEALQQYRKDNIPITLVGDSKGGEDAAYLALSFVKSTKSEHDMDYSAVSVYLTNPKGIRVSDEDYRVLENMAARGNITVEVIYPEVLSKFGLDKITREIPHSCKVYTVPNRLRSSIDNHTIGNYEDEVYQGLGGNYKFQCDEEPTKISESSLYADHALGMDIDVFVGYRYVVSRITDQSGKTMSVNDYFFEAKRKELENLCSKIELDIMQLTRLKEEPLDMYFTNKVIQRKSDLMRRHESLIRRTTPFSMYIRDKKDLMFSSDMMEAEMKKVYERELESHVAIESSNYMKEVRRCVERNIELYKIGIENEIRELTKRKNRIQEDLIPTIEASKRNFQQSQNDIKMVVEKRILPGKE